MKKSISNEFRYLVDIIQENYFMSHKLISSKLGISNTAFYRYYSGLVAPKKEFIDELNDLFTISDEDLQKVREKEKKERKFFEIVQKLSNLDDKHKQEIYDMVESYYEEENMVKTKKI